MYLIDLSRLWMFIVTCLALQLPIAMLTQAQPPAPAPRQPGYPQQPGYATLSQEPYSATAAASAAPPAEPMEVGGVRFLAFGHFGFGGKLKLSAGGESATVDETLDPSLGVMGRVEVPVARFFIIGVQLGGVWFGDSSGRDPILDVSALPKVPVARFQNTKGVTELSLAMPVGFSALFSSDLGSLLGNDKAYGWNIGLLAGVHHFFRSRFALMLEIGWMRHELNYSIEGEGNIKFSFNQFVLQPGIGYIF